MGRPWSLVMERPMEPGDGEAMEPGDGEAHGAW